MVLLLVARVRLVKDWLAVQVVHSVATTLVAVAVARVRLGQTAHQMLLEMVALVLVRPLLVLLLLVVVVAVVELMRVVLLVPPVAVEALAH